MEQGIYGPKAKRWAFDLQYAGDYGEEHAVKFIKDHKYIFGAETADKLIDSLTGKARAAKMEQKFEGSEIADNGDGTYSVKFEATGHARGTGVGSLRSNAKKFGGIEDGYISGGSNYTFRSLKQAEKFQQFAEEAQPDYKFDTALRVGQQMKEYGLGYSDPFKIGAEVLSECKATKDLPDGSRRTLAKKYAFIKENGQWIDYQSSTVRLKSDLERAKNQQKMLEERLAEYKAEGRDTYLTEQRLESEKSRAERLEKQLQEKQ